MARFRRVLLAAQRTRRYKPALESAGLTSPGAINRLCSIEEALQKLPCMDWAEFQGSPADFYNPAAPAPALQRLRYPTNRQIRTAVLGPRLVECTRLVLGVKGRTSERIFGEIDSLKFRSSMTLFAQVTVKETVFEEALGKYFEGEGDVATLEVLE